MRCGSAARHASFALLLLAAGCGIGGGGGAAPSFIPAGPITVTVFGQRNATATTPGNPLQIPHGTAVSVHLAEDIYVGMYTASVVTNPPSSPCITINPLTSDYVFTISVSAGAGCAYPQTADITFAENYGHTTTLYVEGT
jgi:hypothetical protein